MSLKTLFIVVVLLAPLTVEAGLIRDRYLEAREPFAGVRRHPATPFCPYGRGTLIAHPRLCSFRQRVVPAPAPEPKASVPEPGSLWLMLAVIAAIAWVSRRGWTIKRGLHPHDWGTPRP